MQSWHQHNHNTWIIEDQQQHVVALAQYNQQTELYSAQIHTTVLGLYTSLEAAQSAAKPLIHQALQHKITKLKTQHEPFSAKTPENMPWDS
jgi:hypothetical protein